MSAILKALKQVDRAAMESQQHAAPILHSRIEAVESKRWPAYRSIGIVIGGLLLAMACIWVWHLRASGQLPEMASLTTILNPKDSTPTSAQTPKDRGNRQQITAESSAVNRPESSKTGVIKPVLRHQKGLVNRSTHQPDIKRFAYMPKQPEPITKNNLHQAPLPVSNKRKAQTGKVESKRSISSNSVPTQSRNRKLPAALPQPAKTMSRKPPQKTPPKLPILQDSGLALQAIAWSRTPAQRMAVINENILREGGSISGYTIVHIDEDEVIVGKDRKEWRIPSK